jgi:hypothetical protein
VLESIDELETLPPGYLLDLTQMSPAANLAHILLCIQYGKDAGFYEWFNFCRNTIGEAPADLTSDDDDDSGFVDGE